MDSVFLVRAQQRLPVSWSCLSHPPVSLTDTTRAPRPGEEDGKQYYFVTRDKFKQLLEEGAFIEHAEFSGNFYGTSFMTVRKVSSAGRRCILDIEAQVCPPCCAPSL